MLCSKLHCKKVREGVEEEVRGLEARNVLLLAQHLKDFI